VPTSIVRFRIKKTQSAYAKNRRVEFLILKRTIDVGTP